MLSKSQNITPSNIGWAQSTIVLTRQERVRVITWSTTSVEQRFVGFANHKKSSQYAYKNFHWSR